VRVPPSFEGTPRAVPDTFPPCHSGEAYTASKTGVQDPSHGKRFRNESFKFRAIITADCSYGISVPLIPQPPVKMSNKTKRIPLPLQKRPKHTKSSPPPQLGRTTSHPQIAHKLGQQGPYGAARMDALSSHRCGVV
jgi:hypothetical protein